MSSGEHRSPIAEAAQSGDVDIDSAPLILTDAAGDIVFCAASLRSKVSDAQLLQSARQLRVAAAAPDAAAVETVVATDRGDIRVFWSKRAGEGGWAGLMAFAATPAPEQQIDPLTGLADRRALERAFRALAPENGAAPDQMFALYVDLDRFKQVNDTLGHEAGDLLLKRVAQRLNQSTRGDDVVARLGGDEFAVLGAASEGVVAASDIADRIVETLGRPFLIKGNQVSIGASVGIAIGQAGDKSVEDVLRRADIALYASKNSGRGKRTLFQAEMLDALNERRLLENDLRRALLLDQFEVHYQPQIRLGANQLSGFEALLRWRRPGYGLTPPGQFIPLAEETGLIIGIGEWVLTQAARAATRWPDALSIAVNVSPIQFEAPGFVDVVRKTLMVTQLAPHRLELEITEAMLLRDEALVKDRMNALRELGVKISVDDFGAGHSSLGYLSKYPFDVIKIDQSFIRQPGADRATAEIVAAVTELGRSLGMSVLAEGVETEEQLDRVRHHGCDAVQGFFFSKPMPETDVSRYLSRLPPDLAAQKPEERDDA